MCFLLPVSQKKCKGFAEFNVPDDRLRFDYQSKQKKKIKWLSSSRYGWEIPFRQNRSGGWEVFQNDYWLIGRGCCHSTLGYHSWV